MKRAVAVPVQVMVERHCTHDPLPNARITGKSTVTALSAAKTTPFIANSHHGNGSEPSGLLQPPLASSSAVTKWPRKTHPEKPMTVKMYGTCQNAESRLADATTTSLLCALMARRPDPATDVTRQPVTTNSAPAIAANLLRPRRAAWPNRRADPRQFSRR